MKKLFMYIMALSLIANIACGKKETNNSNLKKKIVEESQSIEETSNQNSKAENSEQNNIVEVKQEQDFEEYSFQYPLFDTYRVGEKFENKGYEGKELKEVEPLTYTETDPSEETTFTIKTTKQGTIFLIQKKYKEDIDKIAEYVEKEYKIKLEKDIDGSYHYNNENAVINISKENDASVLSILDKELQSKYNEDKINISFGPYRVGDKFENQGYEEKRNNKIVKIQLKQKNSFQYETEEYSSPSNPTLEIFTTKDGTIAKMAKVYRNYEYGKFIKIFEQKLGYPLQRGRNNYYLSFSNTTVNVEYIIFGELPLVIITNKTLWEQREKDITDYKKEQAKKELEKIKKEADSLEL